MKNKLPLKEIVELGFRVYTREPIIFWNPREYEYAYFTDGVNIGYIQHGRHSLPYAIGTVHRQGHLCGTGFEVGEIRKITKEALIGAFVHHPSWVSRKASNAVVKYHDWEEFRNSSSWNSGFHKYEPESNV